MPVTLPGKNDSKRGHLEKSTDRHKKRQVVKSRGNPLHHQGAVRRQPRGGLFEDLGNALVSIFPVEMQYNIRGTCKGARRAVRGVIDAVGDPIQKFLSDNKW